MTGKAKPRTLSIRAGDDVIACIENFRRAQVAIPTQTEALRALVRLGFDRWKDLHQAPKTSN